MGIFQQQCPYTCIKPPKISFSGRFLVDLHTIPILCSIFLPHPDASDSPPSEYIPEVLRSSKPSSIHGRVHLSASNRYAIAISLLRRHIETVLNLDEDDDDTSDLMDSLNIHNPNPVYVFLIPGQHTNRTVAYRRSDFVYTAFPNTTILQHFHKMLRESSFKPYVDAIDDQQMTKQLHVNNRRFLAKYKEFLADHSDELHSLNAIEENVRTEKNFFKFMDEINGNDRYPRHVNRIADELQKHFTVTTTDYRALIQELHSTDSHVGNFALKNESSFEERAEVNDEVSWDDLGLHGWSGKIAMKHNHPQENRYFEVFFRFFCLFLSFSSVFRPLLTPFLNFQSDDANRCTA